jgi:hypothetical protein
MTPTTPTTTPTGTGPPEPAVLEQPTVLEQPAVNSQAAVAQEARDQVRRAAAVWLTADRTASLGRQMVLSITRYRRGNRRSPTWAEALTGVDPVLCEPITTVPEGWPLAPAVWRRELRQRLMGELKHTRWVTYTRTPRSLHPGEVGRGWLSTTNPPPDGQHPPDTTR